MDQDQRRMARLVAAGSSGGRRHDNTVDIIRNDGLIGQLQGAILSSYWLICSQKVWGLTNMIISPGSGDALIFPQAFSVTTPVSSIFFVAKVLPISFSGGLCRGRHKA